VTLVVGCDAADSTDVAHELFDTVPSLNSAKSQVAVQRRDRKKVSPTNSNNTFNMFAKRKTKTVSLPPKKRKHGAIEEISFDFGAREDFLTGFHKRKLQRIKHAQEQAAKKEREERIANRKAVRTIEPWHMCRV
jgi:hypothetical protein